MYEIINTFIFNVIINMAPWPIKSWEYRLYENQIY